MLKNNSWIKKTNLNPCKYILVTFLLFITPLTLFLMSFSWYDSIEVHIANSMLILKKAQIFSAALVFGAIGLTASLGILFFYLIIDFALEKRLSFTSKSIFLISVIMYTMIFSNFETFSIIFIKYYFSIELLLALFFWPLIYGLLITIAILNFNNALKNKTNISIKKILVNDMVFVSSEGKKIKF